ncbi:MAG: homoserine O-acetyltransferase [Armatimonadetes bacterium]|nr:homoserine O-acetyltransferase [Armatimonadota bacterium]
MDLLAGGHLPHVEIAYETWGELNEDRTNAVFVCHALSGDSHCIGWWDRIVGPGLAIDTERFFVVGTNALGGCQGSTGPSSSDPEGNPWGSRFPVIQLQDMVAAQARVADQLGIEKWHLVAGGSMGGMQALEWGIQFPDRVANIWMTASCSAHSAMQIGFNEAGRQAILRDSHFNGGDYYDSQQPSNGLSVARMIGHLSYLSDASFTAKFGRSLQDKENFEFNGGIEFAVESYLSYQGDKFTQRFDANSYLVLTKAIDYWSREDLSPLQARLLLTSFTSDWIYPNHQSVSIFERAQKLGKEVEHHEIDLPMGHDSFLLDGEHQARILRNFLSQ